MIRVSVLSLLSVFEGLLRASAVLKPLSLGRSQGHVKSMTRGTPAHVVKGHFQRFIQQNYTLDEANEFQGKPCQRGNLRANPGSAVQKIFILRL